MIEIKIPKWIIDIFKSKEEYLSIKEGKRGLECYTNYEQLKLLTEPYKKQITAFIDSIKEALDGGNK